MKWLVVILMVVLLSFLVSAEIKVVHNEWHAHDDTFKVDNLVFDLLLSAGDQNLLRVKIDNDSVLFINYQRCKEFDVYTICYNNKSITAPTATYEGASAIPGIKINITKQLGPNLAVTLQVPKLKVEEMGKFNITLKNSETIVATSYRIEMSIPSGVEIKDMGDFQKVGDKLIYSGTYLKSGSEVKKSFTIISSQGGAKKGNYTIYMTGDGVTRNKTGAFTIDVAIPFTLTNTLTPKDPSILDKSKLSFVVKNTASKDIKITSIYLTAPSELFYTGKSGLNAVSVGRYNLEREVILKPQETKEFYIQFLSQEVGKFNITADVNVLYNGRISTLSFNKTATYSAKGMVPSIITNKAAVLGGEKVEIVYYVENTNEDMSFYNITMKVYGDFAEESLSWTTLNPNGQGLLLRKVYTAPLVDKDKTYMINATIDYYTVTKERRQMNITKKLTVTSNGTIITVDQKASVKEVFTGDEFIVDINVKNMKEENFDVVIEDVIPHGAKLIGGTNSRSYTIRGKQTDVAYSYKIFVPLDYVGDTINLTTTLSIPAHAYEKIDTTTLKVKRNANVTIPANIEDDISGGIVVANTTTKTETTKGIDVKEQDESVENVSAFKKFFRAVDRFFNNLF